MPEPTPDRFMNTRWLTTLACILITAPGSAGAQKTSLDSLATADTALRHVVRLRDGSTLVGRVIAVTWDSATIALPSGTMTFARAAVSEVKEFPATRLHRGVYWPENPNPTRLLFSATAESLRKGEGYYWNTWLFFHGAAYGITDRLTMGAGFSLVPGLNLDDDVFYLTPKLALVQTANAGLAIGALLAFVPGLATSSGSNSLGILYGVGTTGSRESNLSLGLGWGYVGGELADRPIVMLGGQSRLSRRLSAISENWFVPADGRFQGAVSYGLRFLAERLSVDLAFVNSTEDPLFPGVPWLGFAVKF